MLSQIATNTRLRIVASVFDGVLGGMSRIGRMHPNARLDRHHVECIPDVRYAEGTTTRSHLLDIWRPVGAKVGASRHLRRHAGPPWPIVLYVHGGAFTILSKDSHWMMALAFARRGFLVFNVDYRLAPKHRYPAAIEDVCRAFAWVAKNAAKFGGDTSRVVFAGESAGANLVTSLTIALAYERPEPFAKLAWNTGLMPKAVVPACGIFQVSDHERFRRNKPHIPWWVQHRLYETEAAYLGRGPWACSLDLADPVSFLERGEKPARPLPPFFMPVGTRDVLLADTRRLGAALRSVGAEATERYYPGEAHAFHTTPRRPASKQCWAETFSFIEKYIPTEEPPAPTASAP